MKMIELERNLARRAWRLISDTLMDDDRARGLAMRTATRHALPPAQAVRPRGPGALPHVARLTTLLLALLVLTTLVEAGQKSVELGVLPEPLGGTAVIVSPGSSYLNIEVINIVNHRKSAWFTSGDSTYVMAFEFEPFGPDKKPKWTYAASVSGVSSEGLGGAEQGITIGARRIPIPAVVGGAKPTLRAHVIELDRANDAAALLKSVNGLLGSLPHPYTAAAGQALSGATDMYETLVKLWFERNKEHVELSRAGFDFLPAGAPVSQCGTDATAVNPLLGRCIYVLMGARSHGNTRLDMAWVRQNLAFDITRKRLVYSRDVTFPGTWSDNSKRKSEVFDLASYLLFRFDVTDSEFHLSAMWGDEDLRSHFMEARQIAPARDVKWEGLRNRVVSSHHFHQYDVNLLRAAWNKFMTATGPCADWDAFWAQECLQLAQADVRRAYHELKVAVDLAPPEFERGQQSFFSDPTRLVTMTAELRRIQQITQLQRRLRDLGFEIADPVGTQGGDTTAAIKSFQLKHGLPATGGVDPTTRERLQRGGP